MRIAKRSNYAFKRTADQALRSNQTVVPQRLNAALDLSSDTVEIPWAGTGRWAEAGLKGVKTK